MAEHFDDDSDFDIDEVARFLESDRSDPEALARVRAMVDRFRKRMGAKYGKRNIAVDLVRDARESPREP